MTPAGVFAWALALGGCACVAAVTTLVVVSCVRGVTSALRPLEPRDIPVPFAAAEPPARVPVSPAYERWVGGSSRGTRPLDS